MNEIQKYIAAHEPKMMDDLFSLIRIPSISALPEHHDDMLACAERWAQLLLDCLLYTSPSPRDGLLSRMPSSA